jgi:simple sugar transport system ATP-binding protein
LVNKTISAEEEPSARDVILRVQNISKSFGTLRANTDISFELRRGQVLALLGENGAGKTTLMNILFGHYVADEGSIEVFGEPLAVGSPQAAIDAGIGMVHQHFTLADNISVLENIILGTQSLWSPFLDRARARARLERVMAETGLRVDPDSLVGFLTVGQKQRVEILKALYRGVRILILDEPTAVLTPQEAEQLFATVRTMVEGGMSVIFISHKLKEVMSISERVIVLRAGTIVFEGEAATTSREKLAHAMIGRELEDRKFTDATPGEPVLELTNVNVVEHRVALLQNINLVVRRGEIVGVVGVSGNGQEPLFQLLSGLRDATSGRVSILGKPAASPSELIDRGVGRIPEDRHTTGLVVDMPVWENIIAESYQKPAYQKSGFVRRKSAMDFTRRIISQFDIRCSSIHAPARLLSGGNMQKLILGRNLARNPELIIANQPTRGLDVGAVAFVHDRLVEAKKNGAGVLLISEDLDELLSLSDRLVVAFAGQISSPLARKNVTIEKLGSMMMGHAVDAA